MQIKLAPTENRIPITTSFVDSTFQEDMIDSTFRVLLPMGTKTFQINFSSSTFPFPLFKSQRKRRSKRAIAGKPLFYNDRNQGCARVYRNKFPRDVIACPKLVTECNSFYFTLTPPLPLGLERGCIFRGWRHDGERGRALVKGSRGK